MRKLFLVLPPIVIVLALLTQYDDELSADANALLNTIDSSAYSASYVYLLGMQAHEDEDPAEVGAQLLVELEKSQRDEAYQFVEYPASKRLALPTGAAFCAATAEGCIESLFDGEWNIRQLTREHATLIARADQFLDFNEYTTLTRPSIRERIPQFQYVTTAERLKVLGAISQYKSGEHDEAVASLLRQFEALRRALALQDQIVGKLVMLIKLSEIIDVLSVILSETGGKIDPLDKLTLDERDLSVASAREFALNFYSLKGLDGHPQLFDPDIEVPSWLSQVFFKPNMTINAITPIYKRWHRLSQLTPVEFARHAQNEGKHDTSIFSVLRNPVGNTLAKVFRGLNEYVSPFMDFQAKVALFNHVYHLQADLEEASNPYYPGEGPEVNDGKACFRGPLRDVRSMRCLKIKRDLN